MNATQWPAFVVPPKTVVKRSAASIEPSIVDGVEILAATPGMLKESAEVCERVFGAALERLAPIDQDFWWADMRQNLRRADRLVLVARSAGRTIGGLALALFPAAYSTDVRHVLSYLPWVAPGYRSKGIDERLRAAGEEWARSKGARFITAIVFAPPDGDSPKRDAVCGEAERAFSFYDRGGYRPAELRFVKDLG